MAVENGWIVKNPFSTGASLTTLADEKPRERILTKEASLPRRVAPEGSKSISLFEGYRSAVILLDADGPGRKAAAVIGELIKQQSPKTRVRDVVFSDVSDVCEFFDQGRSLDDLIKVIRATPPKDHA